MKIYYLIFQNQIKILVLPTITFSHLKQNSNKPKTNYIMKLHLRLKSKSSNLSFSFSAFICAILFLLCGNANAQIIETFTSPTANSLNATTWAANTAYVVNQYVHSVDMVSVPPINRLYKVTVAGTSTTTQPVASADVVAGATFNYVGSIPLSSTWTCPTGVTSIQVECWGAGGAGGSASTSSSTGSRSGGGGAAGSYVKKTMTVVPGTVYNLVVGLGGYKGATSSASGYYGNLGGKSEFSGGSVTTLTASGGTGGSGSGASTLYGVGGVLGGVYGYNVTGAATVAYTAGVVTLSGGGAGTGATATANVSSTLATGVTYIGATNQGSGYTSNPAVSVSVGTGQSFLAYANPNINSSGTGIVTTLGGSGANGTATAGGAGGSSPDGLAGGAGGTGTVVGTSYVGATATNAGAGGGGGFSFYGTGTTVSGAGGAGANGKIVITYSAPITTYTYTGTGDLHNVTNWADGSNNRPANFTADFQIFKINSNATTTAPWTVSGAASKVVVGDATTTNVSLTIASGFGITATMDVTNGNKVYVQDVTLVSTSYYMNHPTFGTLGDTSEVHYQNSTINNALVKTPFTYGKLYIDGNGTGTVFFSGATNPTNHIVKTLFEVASGSNAYFSEISYYYMTLNSGAQVTINGTLKSGKVTGFVSSNVGTASSTFASLQFIGSEALTLGANSTIEYNRASSTSTQTITPRTDYKNLTLSGLDNIKSFTGATAVSGTLKLNITGTSTLLGVVNLTLGNGATIARTSGSLNEAPIFGTTTNIIYDGTTAVTTSFEVPNLGLNNVTINNAAGVTSSASNTINGVLNFISGKLITGNNFVTIGTSGSITGAGATTGWVVGNLIKQTATNASPSFAYAIGDATNYTPISLTFTGNNTASTAGSITATTTVGDHPQIATSGLDSNNTVNRTWNLLNNGISGFTNYTANLTYSVAETDATAVPANFAIRKYEGTTWAATSTLATPTDSGIAASGITGFGDFAVGNSSGTPTVSAQPQATTVCSGSNTTFTASAVTSSLQTTTKWQRSIGGTVWTDITANLDSGTTYSNFTTGTLTLTGTAAALNNYQYRAVFTSINGSTNSSAVALTVNTTAAPTASAQSFCNSGTVVGLTATGSALQWYSSATGGTALATTAALTTGNYYVSQTVNSCQGPRTTVAVTVNITAAPTGAATQSLSSLLTISSIVVMGTNVVWYASSTNASAGVNPLPSNTLLTNTTYYATQTVGGCVSLSSLAVTITTLENQNFELQNVKIVPNPSTNSFVTVTSTFNEDIDVVVFDMLGKQISNQILQNNKLDVSGLTSGIYLLKISQKEKTTTKKLVVK